MKRSFFQPMNMLFLILSLLSLNRADLFAQVDRGGIVGTITDSIGAVVPGVTVTITHVGTNQSTKLTTDVNGNYTANLLHIGTYTVTVEKEGFQKTVQS